MSDTDGGSPGGRRGGRGGGRGRRGTRQQTQRRQGQQQTPDHWQKTPKAFREWARHLVTRQEYNELALTDRSALLRDFTLAQKAPPPPPPPISNADRLIQMLQRFLIAHSDPYAAISEAHYSKQDSESVRISSVAYYGLTDAKFCQVLGKVDPNRVSVVNSHIWPRHAAQDLSFFDLDPSSVHDARNVLRLQKDIERAFDSRQLTFIEDTTSASSSRLQLIVKILCPKSVSDAIDLTGTKMRLSDIEGRGLLLPNGQVPFRRILAHHAVVAHRYARASGWLSDSDLSQAEIQASALMEHSLDEEAQSRLKLLWHS